MKCLSFYLLLNCPIWPVRLQVFVTWQVKSDSLDLKQPIKPQIRADNKQSYSSIFLLTQLKVLPYSLKKYQSARNLLAINFIVRCSCLLFLRSNNRALTQQDGWNTQDGRKTQQYGVRLGMHSLAPHFFVILPSCCISSLLLKKPRKKTTTSFIG